MKSASELDLGKKYTYADYPSLQFNEIVELNKGKVFMMSPAPGTRHQEVSRNLLVQLDSLIFGIDPCMVFMHLLMCGYHSWAKMIKEKFRR